MMGFKLPDLTQAMGKLDEFIRAANEKIDAQTAAIQQLGRITEMLWKQQAELKTLIERMDPNHDRYGPETGGGSSATDAASGTSYAIISCGVSGESAGTETLCHGGGAATASDAGRTLDAA